MEDEQHSSEQRNFRAGKTLADLSTPIYGLFILGVLYTLYLAHQIILPMVLALLTSLLLSPLVSRMSTGLRMPRMVSSLILVLLVLTGIAGVSLAVATPALEWAGKAPEGISRLLVGESELKRQISKVTESAQKKWRTLLMCSRRAATRKRLLSRQPLFCRPSLGVLS